MCDFDKTFAKIKKEKGAGITLYWKEGAANDASPVFEVTLPGDSESWKPEMRLAVGEGETLELAYERAKKELARIKEGVA